MALPVQRTVIYKRIHWCELRQRIDDTDHIEHIIYNVLLSFKVPTALLRHFAAIRAPQTHICTHESFSYKTERIEALRQVDPHTTNFTFMCLQKEQ